MTWDAERRRLAGLEAMLDPFSRAAVAATGLARGWKCLDVGAGGGSIASWMASVGAEVVATDLDTRFIEQIEGIEASRHDITADAIESDTYDLVHARCLLEHLPQRDVALERMIEALKPGGWIVVEDFDYLVIITDDPLPVHPPALEPTMRSINRAIGTLMTTAGYDASFGRRLPLELIGAGLEDVHATESSRLVTASDPARDFFRLTLEQIRGALVGAGLLDDETIDRALEGLDAPDAASMSVPIVSAWGRKRR